MAPSLRIFFIFLLLAGILQPHISLAAALANRSGLVSFLAPQHRKNSPEVLRELFSGLKSLSTEQRERIADILASKFPEPGHFREIAESSGRWAFLAEVLSPEGFLQWLDDHDSEALYLNLMVLPLLSFYLRNARYVSETESILAGLKKKGLTARQIDQWAAIVAYQDSEATKIGLAAFANAIGKGGYEDVLALAGASVWHHETGTEDHLRRHAEWMRHGTLDFIEEDAIKPSGEKGSVDIIYFSDFYDSLPQRLIFKRGDLFYELKVRPILRPSRGPAKLKNGKDLNPDVFRKMLRAGDRVGIAQVDPQSFRLLEYEWVHEPIELKRDRQVADLAALIGDLPENAIIPVSETAVASLQNSLPLLKPSGEILSLDMSVEHPGDFKTIAGMGYTQALGATHAVVNALAFQKASEETGAFDWKTTEMSEWLEEVHGEKFVAAGMLRGFDRETVAGYYPVSLMRNHAQISEWAGQVQRQHGYSPGGTTVFLNGLRRILGRFELQWGFAPDLHDYLEALQYFIIESVMTKQFLNLAFQETVWIGSESGNQKFLYVMERLGFDERLVAHFFEQRERLRSQIGYALLRISPRITPSKLSGEIDLRVKSLEQAA